MNRCLKHVFTLVLCILSAASSFAQLTGTKTIGGTTPDFATIKAALQALTAQGTAAPGVTFLIRSGTYNEDTLIVRTSSAASGSPIVIKPDAGANVVINIAAGISSAFKVDSTKYVTIDGSNNGSTSRNMTINALSASTQYGILVSGQSYFTTIKNCIVHCNNLTNSRGIGFVYTTATGGNPSNSVADNNMVQYAYQGIYSEGNSSTDLVNDLAITNNVVDSAGYAGIYVWYTTRPVIRNNNVNGLASYSGTKYGIYMGSTTLNARIYNNLIHDLVQASTTSATSGINVDQTSTLARHSVFNNFVWGFVVPDAGTNTLYGIYAGGANSSIADTFAYNTVTLTGTSTGNKSTYAFYKGSSTGPAFLRNNILQNTRTDGTTGVAYAIYKTTAGTSLLSNNNNLYVGTPDAQHQTGRISTTNYAALSDWRAGNTSDAVSVAENSPFISGTNLHIQTTVPTALESGGVPVAGITSDIDGDARNAINPDIGADEFNGLILDTTPPSITYTPLSNTSLTGNRTLSTQITDLSGVPVSGTGLPRLYWRRNSGVYSTVTGAFVSGSQYTFTFGSGVVTGDTVSYFIVAQDNAAPPNVGAWPSTGAGGFTVNPPAAATPPTNPSTYRIVPGPLAAGDYTIGLTLFEAAIGKRLTTAMVTRRVMKEVPAGPEINHKTFRGDKASSSMTPYLGTELREVEESVPVLMENGRPYDGPTRVDVTDALRSRLGLSDSPMAIYPTITAAVSDLNLRGVGGSVRFLLNDATYPSETYPITIGVATDSVPTASKTVTLKPNTGVTATIAGSSASGPILRVSSNFVTIDGSNTAGGTTQNLTLQNTSTTSPMVILYGSNGTTPVTDGTLKNTIVINGVMTSSAVIISDMATPGNPGYFANMTVQNCSIRNAYIALYINGGTTPQGGTNVQVLSNTITSTATDSIRYVGVYMQGVSGAKVSNNNIGAFSVVTGEVDRGVWLASGTINARVERNTIHDLGYVGGSGYGGKGVVISSGLTTSCFDTVCNNMIYRIFGDGDNYGTYGAAYCPAGIYAFSTAQTDLYIYYNTVYLSGSSLNYNANVYSVGIGLEDGSVAAVKNNLIINKLGLLAATGVGPVGIAARNSSAQVPGIDNNNYYSNAASPAVNNIGKIGATDYPTLTAWAAASGGEAHSISSDVNFVSGTDLHISTASPSPVDSAATPVAGVTNDFDGQNRNATRPDIGADEFSRVLPTPPTISAITRSTRVPNALDSLFVTARIVDSSGVGITADTLMYSINGGAAVKVNMPRISGTNTDGMYRGVIPGSANANGNRIEYRVMAVSGSGSSTTTAVAAANSYFAGVSPLSTTGVRAMDAGRALLYTNYYCRVTGVVNGPNFTLNSNRISYTFQDAVGGMNVNKGSTLVPALNVGDSVVVLGVLGQFRGTTQMTPDTATTDIQIVATGRPVPVTDVTVNAFNANPEQHESRLIRMTSLQRLRATPAWGGNVSIPVYQGVNADSTLLFIDADTPVPSGPEPTYPVTVTGIGGQFTTSAAVNNDGYEIIPRSSADFSAPASGLIGNYTVGTGGNYTTLSAAVAALKSNGVAGPVTFLFTDASYTDTAQVISSYPGQGTANTVTFKPSAGISPRILLSGGSTATNTVGIRMDSVSGITWDGSNSGGTTRDMTIESDTATTTARTPVFIRQGSRNITLKNLIIKGNRHSAGTIPSVVVIDNTGFAASGGQHNITITNCQLMRGNNGIFQNAASGAVRDSNHTFTNNLIGGGSSTSVFDHLAAAGVTMTGNHNVLVSNNDINGIKFAGSPIGVRVNGANTAVSVTRNKIHNLVNLSGATRPQAFLVGNIIATGPGVRTRAVISNNMIYDVHNFGTGASGRAVNGLIYNPTGGTNSPNGVGSTIEWYNNSWHFDMASGEGAGNTAFIFDANFAGSNPNAAHSDSIKFYNNIASVRRADTAATRMWLIFGEAVAGNLALQSNNNTYYSLNSAAGIPFAQIPSPWPGGTTNVFVSSVSEFRDSTRLDSASNFGSPQFVSSTDAHISSTVPTPVESRGRIIAGITTDIDGDIRFGSPGYAGHGTAPDIGADEGDFLPLGATHDIGVMSLATASSPDSPMNTPAGESTGEPMASYVYPRAEVIQDSRELSAEAPLMSAASERTGGVLVAAPSRKKVSPVPAATSQNETATYNTSDGAIHMLPGSDLTFFSVQDTVRFKAVVKNYGAYPESTYQVSWSIDGVTQPALNNSRILAPAAQDTFTFRWNNATPGTHTARAWTLLGTDANHGNDTSSTNFTVTAGGPNPGDTLYTFIVPNQIILGVAKIPSNKLVFTSGGQSSAVTTDNKWVVTTMNGAILDTTHLQINNTSGQGFGFRDLTWDGRWLLTSDNAALRRVDTATFTELRPQITGPGTLQRGVAFEAPNRIWKSNFTNDPVVLFDTTGAVIRTLGVPSVAPYGIAFDKWTSPNKGYLWYSQPSVAGTIKLSKVDTATGAILATYDYSVIGGTAGSSGGLDIVNNHPAYPGRVVAFMVIQNFPSSRCLVINLGPDSSVAQSTPGWTAQASGITNQFYSVKAVSPTVAWAAAVGGRVLRTVNGGGTWTSVGGGAIGANDIYAIDAVSANTAFVTTTPSGGTRIFRTTDGGGTWTQAYLDADPNAFINAIKMFDATNGIALGDPVGGKWAIVRTSDGGATWTRDTVNAPAQVGGEAGTQNDLATFGSGNIWFGSSAGGRVYRSTNGGTTWSSGTMPGAAAGTRVISVWFNSATVGIAGHYTTSGVYNAARSTDGGATWSAVTVGSSTSYDIAVAGSGLNDFWMARGTDVYKSTDRGATWAQSYTGTGTFYDLDFYTAGSSTYGWGVKDNGNIVMYFGTPTGVKDQQVKEIPTSFALLQNYPNPFNPSTTIRYGLPEGARVNLTVFNVLGQRVAELVNETQNAGYYNVVWNGHNEGGSQVASGIYFVRIEATPAGNGVPFTSLKKMVMLK